jgi:hypothetical protein
VRFNEPEQLQQSNLIKKQKQIKSPGHTWQFVSWLQQHYHHSQKHGISTARSSMLGFTNQTVIIVYHQFQTVTEEQPSKESMRC